jgi:hypothetical protein
VRGGSSGGGLNRADHAVGSSAGSAADSAADSAVDSAADSAGGSAASAARGSASGLARGRGRKNRRTAAPSDAGAGGDFALSDFRCDYPISEYDLRRAQKIHDNQTMMIQSGILEASASLELAVQPRKNNADVTHGIEDVRFESPFIGKVNGWIYFTDEGFYLREFICESSEVKFGKDLKEKKWYLFNGLFKRWELSMSLKDIRDYQALNFSGHYVGMSDKLNPCNTRCVKILCEFTLFNVLSYIDVNIEDVSAHQKQLPRGNFIYCRGKNGRFYVKFFLKEDFEFLVTAVRGDPDFKSKMELRYSLYEQCHTYPGGYYYHDEDDQDMTQKYPAVCLAKKFSEIDKLSRAGGLEPHEGTHRCLRCLVFCFVYWADVLRAGTNIMNTSGQSQP